MKRLIYVALLAVLLAGLLVPAPALAATPTPTPAAGDKPPAPPLGPRPLGPGVRPRPTATPAAGGLSAAALPEIAPALEVPALPEDGLSAAAEAVEASGPLFDWSASENILVLGTDRRTSGSSWRTDSIMVVGLDKANNRAVVFSVPRDLYVQIPGYGMGRINQADYMGERREANGGGPQLVSDILEEYLGINTQHWVRIQMDGFIGIIDALGGVTINLDCPFAEPIFNLSTNQWENFTLPAGENHLNGQDAYWFARLRYRESDIGRSSRQRLLLWSLRNQVTTTDALMRLPELWTAFADTVSTDYSLLDLIELARWGMDLGPENVRASGLNLKDLQSYVTEQGAQVLVIANEAYVRSLVANVWAAPAMADAYRKDQTACPQVAAEPAVPASVAQEAAATPDPNATPDPSAAPVDPNAPPAEPTAPPEGEVITVDPNAPPVDPNATPENGGG